MYAQFEGDLESKSAYELRVDCSVDKMEYVKEIGEEAVVKHVRSLACWLETDINKIIKKQITITLKQANEILRKIAKRKYEKTSAQFRVLETS